MDLIDQAKKLADTLEDKVQATVSHTVNSIDEATDGVKATATSVAASGMVITDALKDLPRTAEELAREMPHIAFKLRHRAGLRVADSPRSDADIMKLFEKIPGTSKLEASETKIRQFLAGKHGSHVIPRSKGYRVHTSGV